MLTDKVSAAVHYNHISNAGLCSDNEGLDHLGARLGLRLLAAEIISLKRKAFRRTVQLLRRS